MCFAIDANYWLMCTNTGSSLNTNKQIFKRFVLFSDAYLFWIKNHINTIIVSVEYSTVMPTLTASGMFHETPSQFEQHFHHFSYKFRALGSMLEKLFWYFNVFFQWVWISRVPTSSSLKFRSSRNLFPKLVSGWFSGMFRSCSLMSSLFSS